MKTLPEIIAHRGATYLAPENTLTAFQNAIVLGADGVEMDVQQTKDQGLIIHHDYFIDLGTEISAKIYDLTLGELEDIDLTKWNGVDFTTEKLPTLAEASILAPAGARGPAFLVGPNFRTLLRYNNAVNYALGVALLAQQIDGGPGVVAAWPRDLQPLSREQVRTLQTALNERGFDTGKPDGVAGPATRAGLRRYQQSVGAVADGYPTLELLERLTAQP